MARIRLSIAALSLVLQLICVAAAAPAHDARGGGKTVAEAAGPPGSTGGGPGGSPGGGSPGGGSPGGGNPGGGAPGGGNTGGSPGGNTGGGSPGGGNTGGGSAGGNSAGASPGGGGGAASTTLPIESTILEYESLKAEAGDIASAVYSKVPPGSKIVVATANDTVAILQLRSILAQAHVLDTRIAAVKKLIPSLTCRGTSKQSYSSQALSINLKPVAALFASPSDIQAMVSLATSLTAVQEQISQQAGTLNDPSLVSFVAGRLAANNVAVFVPSFEPPHLFGVVGPFGPDFNTDTSYLMTDLQKLEQDRNDLYDAAASNGILTGKCKTDDTAKQVVTLLTTVSKAVDAFEASLFGAAAAAQNAQGSGSTSGGPSGSPSPNASGAPAAPNAGASQSSAGAPSGSATSSTLAQVLYGDLLLHQLAAATARTGGLATAYLLSLHALESGGSQLSKTAVFLGTRQFYSGGAVASFSLVKDDGTLLCSNVTYAYRGFIQADDFSRGVAATQKSGPVPGTQNMLPDLQKAGGDSAQLCQ